MDKLDESDLTFACLMGILVGLTLIVVTVGAMLIILRTLCPVLG